VRLNRRLREHEAHCAQLVIGTLSPASRTDHDVNGPTERTDLTFRTRAVSPILRVLNSVVRWPLPLEGEQLLRVIAVVRQASFFTGRCGRLGSRTLWRATQCVAWDALDRADRR